MKLVKRLSNIPAPRVSNKLNSASFKSDYVNNGYVILRNAFSKDECELLNSTIASDPSISQNTMPMVDSEGKESKLTLWFKIGNDFYSMFARSATVYNAVQTLIETEPYMFHSKVMSKEPKIGGSWEYHQDFGYWYEQGGTIPDQLLSVMIAVDDHTVDNGCLKVFKSSHKFGRVHHGTYNDQSAIDPDRLHKMIAPNCELVHCELNVGDVLIFHSLLVHGSDANTSAYWRRALIMAYNGRYAPVYKKNDRDFVIPSYTPIDVVEDDAILKCEAKIHATDRNDFFSREHNIASFTRELSEHEEGLHFAH